jgi:eukaryotic-like serine/threonine-protein kinase
VGSPDDAPATTDLRAQLQESLGSAYTLERELGGGGMSRVFLATEARLRRHVVVKVLTPELAAGVSADRFEREIMLAAQLSHPNIVPLLAAGDTNGLPYYTMPFVDGESLRGRLAVSGRPPLLDAVNILRDVARALAYAHDRGVVHRDIKPDNVLLASDAAVVTDFGIAKAIITSRATGAGTSQSLAPNLTGLGVALGTPAYMAPEQVGGEPTVDFRSDLYSLGCLAIELLTGEPPFGRRPIHQLLAAHLAELPPDLRAKCPDCPQALATIVMRCLEKDPAARPQSAREVLQVLDAVSKQSGEPHSPADPVSRVSLRRAVPAAVAIVVIAAASVLVLRRSSEPSTNAASTMPRSIAVMPFTNASGDTADTYFADGMAEELATALSKVRGLRVVARNSAFRSGGRDVDPNEAGRTLRVDALLTGVVRRAQDQMRLNVRLTRVSDASLIWSEQYQRLPRDVFAVQDEVTRAIVSALQGQLSPTGATSVATLAGVARGTTNLEAYDWYLKGVADLRRRGSGVRLAAEEFRMAIAKDTGFARAYSGLSAALELFPYFAPVSKDSVYDAAMSAAGHALARDSTLAEAHTSMALAYQHAFQWQRAEGEYRKAIAVDSSDAATHLHYARFLTYVGRPGAALDEARRAEALDPFSAVIAGWVATAQRLSGNPAEAVMKARHAIELDPSNPGALIQATLTFLAAGRTDEARAAADRVPLGLPGVWPGIIAYVHAAAGDTVPAARVVREIDRTPTRPWGAETALAYAWLGLGDTSRALSALERALDTHEMWPSNFSALEVVFDPLRTSPRFLAMLRRVSLDPSLYLAPSPHTR